MLQQEGCAGQGVKANRANIEPRSVESLINQPVIIALRHSLREVSRAGHHLLNWGLGRSGVRCRSEVAAYFTGRLPVLKFAQTSNEGVADCSIEKYDI